MDHLNLRSLLDLIEHAPTTREIGRLLREVGRRLSVHEVVEDQLLLPAVTAARAAMAPVLRLRAAHAHGDLRVAFPRLAAGEAGFDARLPRFVAGLRQHLAEEEQGLFMLARKVLSAERLRALGAQMRALTLTVRSDVERP